MSQDWLRQFPRPKAEVEAVLAAAGCGSVPGVKPVPGCLLGDAGALLTFSESSLPMRGLWGTCLTALLCAWNSAGGSQLPGQQPRVLWVGDSIFPEVLA